MQPSVLGRVLVKPSKQIRWISTYTVEIPQILFPSLSGNPVGTCVGVSSHVSMAELTISLTVVAFTRQKSSSSDMALKVRLITATKDAEFYHAISNHCHSSFGNREVVFC